MVHIWIGWGVESSFHGAAGECVFMHGNSSPDFNDSMSQHSFMAQIFNIDQVVCSWRKCNDFFPVPNMHQKFTAKWPSL